jgi:hypothetical protein
VSRRSPAFSEKPGFFSGKNSWPRAQAFRIVAGTPDGMG